MSTNASKAALTRAAQAETTSDPSSTMTLLADCGTDGSPITSYRPTFAEGAVGAPAHFHTRASELFFVIDGALQVLVDDEVTTLNEGDFLLVPPPPPHTPHAFAPAPGSRADVLFTFTPGMPRFDYLRLLGRVMRGAASPQEIKDSSQLYDNHYVDSPLWNATLDRAAK
ncbi:cupin domain-containing protein [Streptomyces sp. NPDC015171]|uniref:cupin domain-containing protein n=1 Tax=Streptomyces sp. NPDC015171 TaxID=3364945 RepID=UPI0036F638EB